MKSKKSTNKTKEKSTSVITDKDQKGEIILFQAKDGHTKVQVRFEDNSVWLSQKAMADLYQISVPGINQHLTAIYQLAPLSADEVLSPLKISV